MQLLALLRREGLDLVLDASISELDTDNGSNMPVSGCTVHAGSQRSALRHCDA